MPYVEMVDRNGKVLGRYYTPGKRRSLVEWWKRKKNNKKAAAILRRLLNADEKDLPELNIEFTYEKSNCREKMQK